MLESHVESLRSKGVIAKRRLPGAVGKTRKASDTRRGSDGEGGRSTLDAVVGNSAASLALCVERRLLEVVCPLV